MLSHSFCRIIIFTILYFGILSIGEQYLFLFKENLTQYRNRKSGTRVSSSLEPTQNFEAKYKEGCFYHY